MDMDEWSCYTEHCEYETMSCSQSLVVCKRVAWSRLKLWFLYDLIKQDGTVGTPYLNDVCYEMTAASINHRPRYRYGRWVRGVVATYVFPTQRDNQRNILRSRSSFIDNMNICICIFLVHDCFVLLILVAVSGAVDDPHAYFVVHFGVYIFIWELLGLWI